MNVRKPRTVAETGEIVTTREEEIVVKDEEVVHVDVEVGRVETATVQIETYVLEELQRRVERLEAQYLEVGTTITQRLSVFEGVVTARIASIEGCCATIGEVSSRVGELDVRVSESVRSIRQHLCEIQTEVASLGATVTAEETVSVVGSRPAAGTTPGRDARTGPVAASAPAWRNQPRTKGEAPIDGGIATRIAQEIKRLERGEISYAEHLRRIDGVLQDPVTIEQGVEWAVLEPLTEAWKQAVRQPRFRVDEAAEISRQLESAWGSIVAAASRG